jgi:hypothetical protein
LLLTKNSFTNGKLIKWFLLLQEFDITILDRTGKDNVISKFLSRRTYNGDAPPIEDVFPYESIFALYTNTIWFTYINNYLDIGILHTHLSLKE